VIGQGAARPAGRMEARGRGPGNPLGRTPSPLIPGYHFHRVLSDAASDAAFIHVKKPPHRAAGILLWDEYPYLD
jgi:hypothetical protein